MRLYVGNIANRVSEDELRSAFSAYGSVGRVSIMTDSYTGKPKGFAFIEMSELDEGSAAIAAMNGRELAGKVLRVSEVRPQAQRST